MVKKMSCFHGKETVMCWW